MNIIEVMERIHLPAEARKDILQNRISEEEYQEWAEIFHSDFKVFIEKWNMKEKKEQWIQCH